MGQTNCLSSLKHFKGNRHKIKKKKRFKDYQTLFFPSWGPSAVGQGCCVGSLLGAVFRQSPEQATLISQVALPWAEGCSKEFLSPFPLGLSSGPVPWFSGHVLTSSHHTALVIVSSIKAYFQLVSALFFLFTKIFVETTSSV